MAQSTSSGQPGHLPQHLLDQSRKLHLTPGRANRPIKLLKQRGIHDSHAIYLSRQEVPPPGLRCPVDDGHCIQTPPIWENLASARRCLGYLAQPPSLTHSSGGRSARSLLSRTCVDHIRWTVDAGFTCSLRDFLFPPFGGNSFSQRPGVCLGIVAKGALF